MIRTRFCDLLGIEIPTSLSPLGGPGRCAKQFCPATMVSNAVSDAADFGAQGFSATPSTRPRDPRREADNRSRPAKRSCPPQFFLMFMFDEACLLLHRPLCDKSPRRFPCLAARGLREQDPYNVPYIDRPTTAAAGQNLTLMEGACTRTTLVERPGRGCPT